MLAVCFAPGISCTPVAGIVLSDIELSAGINGVMLVVLVKWYHVVCMLV